MNINLCMCGHEAGYPHDLACPYPLFRGTERAMAAWEKEYTNRKAGLAQLSPLPDDRQSSIMEEVAPQPPDDFFDIR